ncbi:MAG: efflux RND transporter periplasmic adaptor subunit [Gammaproteobacteria bacterium]|nr:efflux RND transporter periplasmic adaptor subunit [Gammaproteobacteria bacterium]NIO66149.1 efflux RND transporter periplasmic adaptor subunit [Gammaproteobacteria bacterium]NIP45013.1 efflux RND transporter periplasmic adaptor subunit [Gammaproteobacteria bacterium]NIP65123.1 efflux RND transporter periplasmic adaptor subunit [Gammaproteobacteria bacterium]NIP87543.1 efflux RND transporter periplasmic adaptor subunit [Gammaproteobacteria bacterium]
MTREPQSVAEPETVQLAPMLQTVAENWLAWQCTMITGTCHGVIALGAPDQGPYRPTACWPQGSDPSVALSKTAKAAISKRKGVVAELKSSSDEDGVEKDAIAYPIVIEGKLLGVAAIEVERQPNVRQKSVLQMLQWGAAWFQAMCAQQGQAQHQGAVAGGDKLGMVLELVGTAVEQDRFQAAATGVVTELATRLKLERVSLGFIHGKHVKVKALSHSARFEGRQSLLRQIGAAMDEALDQESTIVYPAASKAAMDVSRAHGELAREHGARAVCTVPLSMNQEIYGAMTFERPGHEPFEAEIVKLCEQAAALVGPILEVKRRDDRWLATKALDSLGHHCGRLFGRGHLLFKTVVVVLVALVAFLSVATGQHRVAATAALEGTVERVAVAPEDGYVATASVRPGDVVKKGEVLATLDSKDLELERVKWTSQREQLTKEYREALAMAERSQVSILRARIEQSDAQIALLNEQLARTQILAPFDGVIVSGDLTRTLGSPVERGQVLYKIAPLNDYRVVLEVDERDFADVVLGQSGYLALAAAPNERLDITVNKITPVSTAEEGSNFFKIEASLANPPAHLRPGMQGVGKIEVGERRLIWIWTHRIVDWLRLWVWAWWP